MMNKIAFAFLFLTILSTNGYGQLWIEDFDGSNAGNPPSLSLECNDNGDSYYGIMCDFGAGCGNEISATYSPDYMGLNGQFLGGRNTDNSGTCGPDDDEFAEWNGIAISSCMANDVLYLCFDIAEGDETPGMGYWDNPSLVQFSVNIDGAGMMPLGSIEQTNGQDSYASFDLNCDGVGDGVYTLTGTMTNYCFEIPGYGNSIDVRIDIDGLNEFGEDVAIDNIGIYCESSPGSLPGTLLATCGACGADADCDGVLVSIDCDDNDPGNTNTNVNDADCDGVPTNEDCDDNDPTNTNSNVNDADCDGVPTNEDCDDNDPTNTNSNVNDADCDGVPTNEDCDDNDPTEHQLQCERRRLRRGANQY